jgi:hypothetical protein
LEIVGPRIELNASITPFRNDRESKAAIVGAHQQLFKAIHRAFDISIIRSDATSLRFALARNECCRQRTYSTSI